MKRRFRNRSFCMLEADLIESNAFLSLPGKAAVIVLIRFYQKAHRKRTSSKRRAALNKMVVTNNGQILFTYSEAKELGMSEATFFRAVRQLVEEKGFIDVAEPGNWYLKEPTRFALSDRWRDFGTPQYKRVPFRRKAMV